MAVIKARENSSGIRIPVAMMGVGNASQSQRGLMTAQDKVKLDNLSNEAEDISYDNSTSGLTSTDVQNAITEIGGFYNTTTYTDVFASIAANFTMQSFNFTRIGRICILSFFVVKSSALTNNTWNLIGTLKSEYIPKHEIQTNGVANGYAVQTRFQTDGKIYSYPIQTTSAVQYYVVCHI